MSAMVGQLDSSRQGFLVKVYAHLMMAVVAFIGIEFLLFQIGLADASYRALMAMGKQAGYGWLLVLTFFGIAGMVANRFAQSQGALIQYTGLLLYVVTEALLFMPMLCMARAHSDPTIIPAAAVSTAVMFTCLSAFVIFTGARFNFLGGVIAVLSIASLGVIVTSLLFGLYLGTLFSAVMVVLAGMCILYETSTICDEYDEDSYVGAALSLFASLALMFWYILRIFMSRD
jgi:FtsH-binding integral membrane protein